MKEYSASEHGAAAAALAAEDDVRIRRRTSAIALLVLGIVVVGGSFALWPQGTFRLVSDGTITALPLVALGAVLLFGGTALLTVAIRRLARLRNHLVSTGKAHSAFVNEPDFQLPAIGMGHGGAMDVSAAKFANPSKLMPGREP